VFAAALGEAGLVGEFIATDLTPAVGLDDDRGWPPLLYACYSHSHRINPARAGGLTAVASLLLDAGACGGASTPGTWTVEGAAVAVRISSSHPAGEPQPARLRVT
jgi:hypothetical protein